jgi:hypothetical protein
MSLRERLPMRFIPKDIDGLRRILDDERLSDDMRVEPDEDTGLAEKTVGELPRPDNVAWGPCRDNSSPRGSPGSCAENQGGELRLIFHPTCVIKPAVDGCPFVTANSMEIEKVRSFLLQIREKDHAAPLGGIVRVIVSPLVVFPK